MHTVSRFAAPPRAALLLLLAFLALIHTPRPAQAADTTPPVISISTSPAPGTYPATPLPTVTVAATITDTGTNASGVDPYSVWIYIYINGSYTGIGGNLSNGDDGSGNVYTGDALLGFVYSNNSGSSRAVTIVVIANDNAGNQATRQPRPVEPTPNSAIRPAPSRAICLPLQISLTMGARPLPSASMPPTPAASMTSMPKSTKTARTSASAT